MVRCRSSAVRYIPGGRAEKQGDDIKKSLEGITSNDLMGENAKKSLERTTLNGTLNGTFQAWMKT